MPAEKGKRARDRENARRIAIRNAEASIRNAAHEVEVARAKAAAAERRGDVGAQRDAEREIRRLNARKADAERRLAELRRQR
jgi:hypothetical protein